MQITFQTCIPSIVGLVYLLYASFFSRYCSIFSSIQMQIGIVVTSIKEVVVVVVNIFVALYFKDG